MAIETKGGEVNKKSRIRYVNSENGLRLRTEPSIEAEILEILPFAQKVKVLKRKRGEDENWSKVKVNGIKGYVHSDYLQKGDPFEDMEYLGDWRITAYAYTGSLCANGNMPTEGYTVASNYLDFGTEVYIEGVGFRTVEDRGSGWLGDAWLDLYLGNHDSCVAWGSQHRSVWIKKEN